jgi:hypothetical protein
MQIFLNTYPVQAFKCNTAAMKYYINELPGYYEKEILGRDNVMAHEERKASTLISLLHNAPPKCNPIYENKYLRKSTTKSTPMFVD